MPEGEGNCLKSLNESVTEKRGEEKKGGASWVKGWVQEKKWGAGNPLRTMV